MALVLKSIVSAAMRGITLPFWLDRQDIEQECAVYALEAMVKVDTSKYESQQAQYCVQLARWRLIDFIRGERLTTGHSASHKKEEYSAEAPVVDAAHKLGRRKHAKHHTSDGFVGCQEEDYGFLDDATLRIPDTVTPEAIVVARRELDAVRGALRQAVARLKPADRAIVEMRLEGRAAPANNVARRRINTAVERSLGTLGYTPEESRRIFASGAC